MHVPSTENTCSRRRQNSGEDVSSLVLLPFQNVFQNMDRKLASTQPELNINKLPSPHELRLTCCSSVVTYTPLYNTILSVK